MLDRIEFLFGEAFQNLRRNGLLTFAAITTVAIALFLIGGFGYAYYQTYRYVRALPTKLDVRIYLKDDRSDDDDKRLALAVERLPGLASKVFIGKDQAWKTMRETHPEIPMDLKNPLPDAYDLTFSSVDGAESAAVGLAQEPAVEKVLYLQDLAKSLRQAFTLLRSVGICGLVLLLIGGIIIYNAIQLAMISRRTEIRIMQLVGASEATIRIPFLIEGLTQGLLGGLVAALALSAAGAGVAHFIASVGRAAPTYPWAAMGGLVLLGGAVLGLVCSTLATKLSIRF